MAKILLEDMEFFAYHGCYKEEQVIGNHFIVNVEIDTDTTAAEVSDSIADTLNYQEAYNLITEQIQKRSHLLEHVTRRIFDALTERFGNIKHLKVKVSKMHPPMGGNMKCVSLVLEKTIH
jgi:7,8-dihydroneopterin aldolase/epimerase/oxygenase